MLDFSYFRINMEKKRWTFGIEVPYLKLESKYNIKGNILLLPVVGTGDSTIHLSKFCLLSSNAKTQNLVKPKNEIN